MMLYLEASKNANTKNCLMSPDLSGTNMVSHVENFPVRANIAEKPTNNGIMESISKSLVHRVPSDTANI